MKKRKNTTMTKPHRHLENPLPEIRFITMHKSMHFPTFFCTRSFLPDLLNYQPCGSFLGLHLAHLQTKWYALSFFLLSAVESFTISSSSRYETHSSSPRRTFFVACTSTFARRFKLQTFLHLAPSSRHIGVATVIQTRIYGTEPSCASGGKFLPRLTQCLQRLLLKTNAPRIRNAFVSHWVPARLKKAHRGEETLTSTTLV